MEVATPNRPHYQYKPAPLRDALWDRVREALRPPRFSYTMRNVDFRPLLEALRARGNQPTLGQDLMGEGNPLQFPYGKINTKLHLAGLPYRLYVPGKRKRFTPANQCAWQLGKIVARKRMSR